MASVAKAEDWLGRAVGLDRWNSLEGDGKSRRSGKGGIPLQVTPGVKGAGQLNVRLMKENKEIGDEAVDLDALNGNEAEERIDRVTCVRGYVTVAPLRTSVHQLAP
ncbi:uncharacterized protein N7511_001025 [Penicillium nucicola]|uniref:uncharacterized protein n=1 Tax=Penicillium nucicola TaxID=1850975 RepID=UPI0025456A62|nr:uncharacterized protein N7511_001025 [Penicillium nucicola]KAJ5776014.1 hypothetical protein N7511_001025 [Penicillium nucicola]